MVRNVKCALFSGPLLGSLKRERSTKKHSEANTANLQATPNPPHPPQTHTEPLINYSHYTNHIQKNGAVVCVYVCAWLTCLCVEQ